MPVIRTITNPNARDKILATWGQAAYADIGNIITELNQHETVVDALSDRLELTLANVAVWKKRAMYSTTEQPGLTRRLTGNTAWQLDPWTTKVLYLGGSGSAALPTTDDGTVGDWSNGGWQEANANNYPFRAPRTGLYLVQAAFCLTTAAGGDANSSEFSAGVSIIYTSGAPERQYLLAHQYVPPNGSFAASGGMIVSMAAQDIVRFFIESHHGNAVAWPTATMLGSGTRRSTWCQILSI